MANVSYQWTDDLMSCFRVSRGFKAGGINPTAPSPEATIPFKPERLLAYEIDFKTQWLDNRLRINVDGFYSSYHDLQVNANFPSVKGGFFRVAGNADEAEIWGMEFEGTALLMPGLEVAAGYSFMAPKYLKWNDTVFNDAGQVSGTRDVASLYAFPDSPHSQLSLGVSYTAPPTTAGTLSAHLDTYWQDKVVFVTNNVFAGSAADEGWAYALVNGRLQFGEIPLTQGSLDTAVFARNLFARKYRTFGIDFTPQLGFATNNYGAPRTFGIGLTYNFAAGAVAPPPVALSVPPSPPGTKGDSHV